MDNPRHNPDQKPRGFYERILAQAIATSREADRAASAVEEVFLIMRRVERMMLLLLALVAVIAVVAFL